MVVQRKFDINQGSITMGSERRLHHEICLIRPESWGKNGSTSNWLQASRALSPLSIEVDFSRMSSVAGQQIVPQAASESLVTSQV